MTTSNSTIDEKYNAAIQSLKKINNELFYDDLKKLMKDREQTIAKLNEEVYESIEKMEKSLQLFQNHASEQVKEELINPQIELFDREMERFNENLTVMEMKVSLWQQHYQEYMLKTEKLLTDLKELQRDEQEFIEGETEKGLTAIMSLKDQLSGMFADIIREQATKLNVKYEAVGERLAGILKGLDAVEDSQKAELENWNQQYKKDQRDLQGQWEEKWQLSSDATAKRERQFKKWLVGLAIGQGVSIVFLVLYFILK